MARKTVNNDPDYYSKLARDMLLTYDIPLEYIAIEYQFFSKKVLALEGIKDKGRGWRFDLALPRYRIALEIEGAAAVFGGGSHQTYRYFKDMEKYNTAAAMGWRLWRGTTRGQMHWRHQCPVIARQAKIAEANKQIYPCLS